VVTLQQQILTTLKRKGALLDLNVLFLLEALKQGIADYPALKKFVIETPLCLDLQ